MKQQTGSIVIWLLLLFILIVLHNIYTLVKERNDIYKTIEQTISQEVTEEVKRQIPIVFDGVDGYNPVKGVDYTDGIKGDRGVKGDTGKQGIQGEPGRNGKDGEKGDKGDKGDTGEKGEAAPLYYQRCNISRNRWEYKYEGDGNWLAMITDGQVIPCFYKESQ